MSTSQVLSDPRVQYRRRVLAGEYGRPPIVQVLAAAWGCATNTAAQARRVSDPRSPAMKLARAITALRHYGYQPEAEQLARPVLLALSPLPLAVNRDDLIEALCAEAEAEGPENAAQAALIDFTPAALSTWVKRAEAEYDRQGAAIRLAKAYLGQETAC